MHSQRTKGSLPITEIEKIFSSFRLPDIQFSVKLPFLYNKKEKLHHRPKSHHEKLRLKEEYVL